MPRVHAKKIALQYVRALHAARYPISEAYLFGSYVKGSPHQWSDIDVAIVSPRFAYERDEDRIFMWNVRNDTRIEPHLFAPKQFHSNEDPLAYEIRRTGMRIG